MTVVFAYNGTQILATMKNSLNSKTIDFQLQYKTFLKCFEGNTSQIKYEHTLKNLVAPVIDLAN